MLFKGVIEMSIGRIKRAVRIYHNTFKRGYEQRAVCNYKYFNTLQVVNLDYKRISNINRMIYNRFEHSVDYTNIDGIVFDSVKSKLKRRQVLK